MAERILKQFETLRRVTPSSAWQENTRAVLMESVKKSNLTNNAFREQDNDRMEQWLTLTYRLRSFLPRPSRAISFAVLVMMFGTMAFATQASTPKDKKFYTIKRVYEKIELAAALTKEKEVEVHLKHAGNRADEMATLVKESETADQAVTNDINVAVQETAASLAANIKAANDTLDIIQEVSNKDESKSETITSLAMDMTKSSQDALKTLETVKQVNDAALTKTVENATKAVEDVETKSLNTLVKQVIADVATSTLPVVASTTGEVKNNNVISEEKLKELITNKIKRVDEKIEATKDILTNSVASGNLSTVDIKTVAEEKVITDLTKAPEVAQGKLNEAKDALANGSINDALVKMNETTVLVDKSVEAIKLAGDNNLAKEAAKLVTPTTTIPTVTPKLEEKPVLKSSAQESIIDGKTATPTEVMKGITDEFGQAIGSISQQTGL